MAAGKRQTSLLRVVKAQAATTAFDIGTHPIHFAQCRALGHSWRHREKPYTEEEDGFNVPIGLSYGTIGLVSTCTNCGGERIKWISRSGEVYSRYHYVDGYQTKGENLVPLDWRKAFIVRLFPVDDILKRARKRA